jgi:hypothetical protein
VRERLPCRGGQVHVRGAGGETSTDAADAIDTAVLVRGRLVGTARGIRTAEGWEVASLRIGGLLVVCAGTGAAGAVRALSPGDEVVVVGRLAARRGACPDDDAVELEAGVLLARGRPWPGSTHPVRPRIAP